MKSLFFSPVEAIKKGWDLTKSYFIVTLGLIIAYGVLSFILSALQGNEMGVRYFIVYLLILVVSIFYQLGYNKILLNATEDIEPEFSVFKEVSGKFFPYLGLYIVTNFILFFVWMIVFLPCALMGTGLAALSGIVTGDYTAVLGILWILALTAIPVIYLGIRWMYAPFVMIDKNTGVMESLGQSWKMTSGNMPALIGFCCLLLLLNIVGFIALIVGIFVTIIISGYAVAVSYRMLTRTEEEALTEAVSGEAEQE